jgi:hypothetical protein
VTTLPYAEWVKLNPPPDLQELIRTHGGYWAIPDDAWIAYIKAMHSWNLHRRDLWR